MNVACGPQILDGFVNVDLLGPPPRIRWDCRRSLPLADGGAAGIRAEQFVEHLDTREELPDFLRDCLRVLEPGGVLRVIVPDAGRYLQAYCQPGLDGFRELAVPDPFPADLPTRMDVINHIFHQWGEHRWAYDFETLALRLRTAGFGAIEQVAYQRSLLPALGAGPRRARALLALRRRGEARVIAVPAGPMVNAGSGPADPPPWINIDGSWQARLAGHRWLARAGSRLLGIEIGHWPPRRRVSRRPARARLPGRLAGGRLRVAHARTPLSR